MAEDYGVTSQSQSADEVFAGGHPPVTLKMTVKSGRTLAKGTIMGRITDSFKVKEYDVNAVDGSQKAIAILAQDCAASAADVAGLGYVHGEFNEDFCSLASVTTTTTTDYSDLTNAAKTDLQACGIFIKDVK